jgi:hypothetical protein
MRARLLIAVSGLALTLGVSACGGGDEAGGSATSGSSAPASAAPSDTGFNASVTVDTQALPGDTTQHVH